MVCKNLKLKPKNKITRVLIGTVGSCKYSKGIKGVHFHSVISKCPYENICKFYKNK